MKKTARILVLTASLALLLALVSTASAGSDKCHKHDPDCPTTTTVPPTTTTTTTTVVPGSLGVGLSCADYATLNGGVFEVESWDTNIESQFPPSASPESFRLTSGRNACIDISGTTGGSFTVKVTSVDPEPKKNTILYALIKDSHPGDHCGTAEGDPRSALNLNLENETDGEIVDGEIVDVPAATLNACGTGYAEAEVQGNEVVNPTIDRDDTPDPLAFMLGITGKPGITASITLTYTPPAD